MQSAAAIQDGLQWRQQHRGPKVAAAKQPKLGHPRTAHLTNVAHAFTPAAMSVGALQPSCAATSLAGTGCAIQASSCNRPASVTSKSRCTTAAAAQPSMCLSAAKCHTVCGVPCTANASPVPANTHLLVGDEEHVLLCHGLLHKLPQLGDALWG